jgi:hypothetical protein
VVVIGALAVVVASAVAVRFVVFPDVDSIGKTDLVVVVDGPGDLDKFNVTGKVVAVNPRTTVLYSASDGRCDEMRRITPHLVCFRPNPDTTEGEARFAAAYATAHHDDTMTVVARRAQLGRARIRFSRCWHGQLAMVEVPMSFWSALRQLPYQTLATIKAETVQRHC